MPVSNLWRCTFRLFKTSLISTHTSLMCSNRAWEPYNSCSRGWEGHSYIETLKLCLFRARDGFAKAHLLSLLPPQGPPPVPGLIPRRRSLASAISRRLFPGSGNCLRHCTAHQQAGAAAAHCACRQIGISQRQLPRELGRGAAGRRCVSVMRTARNFPPPAPLRLPGAAAPTALCAALPAERRPRPPKLQLTRNNPSRA